MATPRPDVDGELRRAIASGDLRLAYQPIVDLNDASLGGVEALLRWQSSSGVLPAGAFLPQVTDTVVLDAVATFVLEEAAAQAALWRRRFEAWLFPVSVNVAASDFTAELATRIVAARERHGLPPGAIALDLSERVLLADVGASRTRLDSLKEAGAQIIVDDFGAMFANPNGRSDGERSGDELMLSLVALETLPVDVVKIDRDLVEHGFASARDEQVMNGIVRLAHLFGYRVLAEGVESGEEAERLRCGGFDLAQGYYFQPPHGPGHIDRLLHDLADARRAFAESSGTART